VSVLTRAQPLVLIVEDDPWIQGITRELLEEEGFAVVSATDGAAGWKLAQRLHPAVILLDIALPRMDGAEFLERVRGHSSLSHTPVIVISGRAESLSERVSALADCVLRKPFDLTELINQVQVTAIAGVHS
jgi:DNA-binding response OmpR family regulator